MEKKASGDGPLLSKLCSSCESRQSVYTRSHHKHLHAQNISKVNTNVESENTESHTPGSLARQAKQVKINFFPNNNF
ncbi:hypothetical protein BaRGS_00013429 [Batillaria attramentaria]|uniref:Uncharacterized protein n=1 Tax=Batillaria attramentaria TaxID=370345 RepID=A0ABD0L7A2_9CAEN